MFEVADVLPTHTAGKLCFLRAKGALPQRGLLRLGGRCLSRRRCGCVLLRDGLHLDGLSLGNILFRLFVFYAPFSELLNKCFCFAWKRMLVCIQRPGLYHDLNGIITTSRYPLLFEIGQTISKSDERIISACGTDARR